MMPFRSLCGLPIVVACALGAGCTSTPQGVEDLVTQRKAIAQGLENNGHLAEAHFQWQVLASMAPGQEDIAAGVARTAERMRVRESELRKSLKSADDRNDVKTQQRIHLRLLALNAADSASLEAARKIEQQHMGKAMDEKAYAFRIPSMPRSTQTASTEAAKQKPSDEVSEEIAGYIGAMESHFAEQDYLSVRMMGEAFISKHEPEPHIAELLHKAYVALGDEEQSRDQLEVALAYYQQSISFGVKESADLASKRRKLQRQLSDQYLQEGMRYFRSDIQKARELFEASLSFDPKNQRAQRELDRAELIEKNLRRINGHAY